MLFCLSSFCHCSPQPLVGICDGREFIAKREGVSLGSDGGEEERGSKFIEGEELKKGRREKYKGKQMNARQYRYSKR